MASPSARSTLLLVGLVAAWTSCASASSKNCAPLAINKYLPSAHLNPGSPIPTTVKLPIYKGATAAGGSVYYIVTEASTAAAAAKYGANLSPLLARAAGTMAVQNVTMSMSMGMSMGMSDGMMVYPASVMFGPRTVTPSMYGWPPAVAIAGAYGEDGYSPLVMLPDGTVLLAPIVATLNSTTGKMTGMHNQAVSFDTKKGTVNFVLRNGFANGKTVLYISTDATAETPAALEGATLAPALAAAPPATLDTNIAFINGQVGRKNPNRQGLNSTLLDGLSPLNELGSVPSDGPSYTPLWSIFLAVWAPSVPVASRTRQMDPDYVLNTLAADGSVTSPDGSALAPAGFLVVCSVVAELLPPAFQ